MYIFFMCAQDNEWHDLIFVAAAAADPEYEQTFAVFIRLRLRLEINNLPHHVNILSVFKRTEKFRGIRQGIISRAVSDFIGPDLQKGINIHHKITNPWWNVYSSFSEISASSQTLSLSLLPPPLHLCTIKALQHQLSLSFNLQILTI